MPGKMIPVKGRGPKGASKKPKGNEEAMNFLIDTLFPVKPGEMKMPNLGGRPISPPKRPMPPKARGIVPGGRTISPPKKRVPPKARGAR